jgi:hypothetical protein
MTVPRILLLSLVLVAYVGSALYGFRITLLARERTATVATPETPTTPVDVVTTEVEQEPVNDKPLAHETRTQAKQVASNKVVARPRDKESDPTREAIKSFQNTAELLTARLGSDVVAQLDLERSNESER